MTSLLSKGFIACALMVGAALAAVLIKPGNAKVGAPEFLLRDLVPVKFSDWRALPEGATQVVNPQAQEMLNSLYSQLLTRTYVNESGYLVMLSVAYGDDQRGGLQAHMPDVCYPAQGFSLLGSEPGTIDLATLTLPVRKLKTALKARNEPVTYWFIFGQQAMRSPNSWQRRVIELREAMAGRAPDGMLVRVSSIDENATDAFRQQERFIKDLVNALPPAHRARVVGQGASM